MEDAMRKEVEKVLLNNTNLFSWNAPEMPSIDPNFIFHKLAIFSYAKLVAQRKHKLRDKRRRFVEAEQIVEDRLYS